MRPINFLILALWAVLTVLESTASNRDSNNDFKVTINTAEPGANLHRNQVSFFQNEKQTGQSYIVKNSTDFKQPEIGKLLENRENYFLLEQTGEVVYYDEKKKVWFLHHFNNKTSESLWKEGERTALTWCIDNMDGGGGYVAPTFELQISAGQSGTLSGSVASGALLLALGVSVSESVTFLGSYTCNVMAGQYGRLYVRPHYYQVPEGRRVQVKYMKGTGLVEIGAWKKTPSYKRLWVGRPLIECSVDTTPKVCEAEYY